MATYVPGYQRYERETTPFTPDYKFMSAVLDTRQDRFDTNYKQLSDQYSKVVYADMSREDTIDARNQYTEQLIPRIEKLSGMDLSIRQNVDSAQSLFKPFYEDDLIVKDLVFTSQYKRNMQLAGSLKASASAEERKKYWATGIQAMNYQMEDFKNDNRDDALKAGLPTYVENVDLETMSMKILKDAGFEDVEMDLPVKKGDPFIIRQKNGSLQVPGAYNFLMKTLMEDPKVIDAYRTSGFVSARNHAEIGFKNGQYSSIGEGKNAWAQSTLEDLRARNEKANPILRNQFEKALQAKQNWERYEKEEGIIPDSDEHKAMLEAFEAFETSDEALKRNEGDLQRMGEADENTDALNFAYNMLMNYNLSSDILGAATSYSKRDYSQTISMENPYTKMQIQHQYNLARDNNASSNRRNELILKGKIEGNVNKKGEIINPAFVAASIFDGVTGPDGGSTIAESTEEIEDPLARNAEDLRKKEASVNAKKPEFITSLFELKQSDLPVAQQTGIISIEINGKTETGNIKQITKLLNKPENAAELENLYKKSFGELTELNKTNPGVLTSPGYNSLVQLSDRIAGETDQLLHWDKVSKETIQKNWDASKTISSLSTKAATDAGVPEIVNNGTVLEEEEFIERYIAKAKKGSIKDADYIEGRGRRDDKGNNTYQAATIFPGIADYMDEKIDEYVWGDTIFVENEAREDAKKYYAQQRQVLNSTLNESYNAQGLDPENKLFQPLSADAYFRGVQLDDMNASNLYTYGGTKSTFSINSIAVNPEVYTDLKNLVDQFNAPGEKIITPSGLSDEELDGTNDVTANQILGESLRDIRGYLLDPKAAASKKFSMGIEMRPVVKTLEDGTIMSGMKVTYTDQYLKDFASTAAKTPVGLQSAAGIKKYSEITMMFPQSDAVVDLNLDKYNFSSVNQKIQMSPDKSYLYDMYKENAGSFRVFNKDGAFYSSMEMLGVNATTGLFEKMGQQPIQLIRNEQGQPAGLNEVDRIVANYRASLADLSAKNLKEQKRIKPSIIQGK